MRRLFTIVVAAVVAGAEPMAAQRASAAVGAGLPVWGEDTGWPALAAAGVPPSGELPAVLRSDDPIVKGRDALLAGAFALGAIAIAPVDRYFAENLQNPRNQENRILRYTAESLNWVAHPGSWIIGSGLYAHGLLRDDRETAALGLHGLEAIAVGSAVAGIIKVAAGRARPYMDVNRPHDFGFGRGLTDKQYRSFPSGHTVAGFAAATVVTSETARWWPDAKWYIAPVMYGGATLIGASRMYTNFHWASDVVIGAAIGTLAGVMIDRYHYSRTDNWIDRKLLPDEGRDQRAPVAPPMVFVWSIPIPR